MQAINVAYDTLSDATKKAEYDQMLDHPQVSLILDKANKWV
jgi:curved DNA-binding protein